MTACRRLLTLAALLLAALGAFPATAQERANHIAAELLLVDAGRDGGPRTYALHFTPGPGWHGYWSNPGDAGYPMSLDWSWSADRIGAPEYPVPHTLVIGGLMNHVYESDYAVLVPVTVPAGISTGGAPLAVEAQWLACTDKICVPEQATLTARPSLGEDGSPDPRLAKWRSAIPAQLDRSGAFRVSGGKLRLAIALPAGFDVPSPHVFVDQTGLVAYAAPQTFARKGDLLIAEVPLIKDATAPAKVSGIFAYDKGDGVRFVASPGAVPNGGEPLNGAGAPASLLVLALGALLGGLLLNVMPCVFPILSLKALSLARAGESEVQARREGLAYTAGVMLACIALGALMLALRAAGETVGWAFQLQEPAVVVALFVLAAAITANFLGLFELPSISLTRSGEPSGAFVTGLLAAFVATPCTGPFMAAALGAALVLPTLEALVLFAALGLGLALPFLAVGFIPALRRMLPKPGRWMETFRKVMAVPMGLTALALGWLLWRLGGPGFAIVAAGLAGLVIFGLGLLWRGTGDRSRRSAALAALGVAAFALVLGLPRIFAPPSHAEEQGVLDARPFSEAALAEARAARAPVFVWFTADWCLTCKVNENVAIEREATRDAFARAGVVAMRGDWTRRDPEITRFLADNGAAGVPLYLWYDADGAVQQLPQVLGPDSLVTLARASARGRPAGSDRSAPAEAGSD